MLKIQVLGKGLIPRGLGLAPRKTPFDADLTLITTILNTHGLSVNYVNPEDGRLLPLNRQNCKRVWDKYNNLTPKDPVINEVDESHPHVPDRTPGATGETVMTNPPIVEKDESVPPAFNPQDPSMPTTAVEPPADETAEVPTEAAPTEEMPAVEEVAATGETDEATETSDETPAENVLRPINAPDNNNRNNGNNNNRNNHKNRH